MTPSIPVVELHRSSDDVILHLRGTELSVSLEGALWSHVHDPDSMTIVLGDGVVVDVYYVTVSDKTALRVARSHLMSASQIAAPRLGLDFTAIHPTPPLLVFGDGEPGDGIISYLLDGSTWGNPRRLEAKAPSSREIFTIAQWHQVGEPKRWVLLSNTGVFVLLDDPAIPGGLSMGEQGNIGTIPVWCGGELVDTLSWKRQKSRRTRADMVVLTFEREGKFSPSLAKADESLWSSRAYLVLEPDQSWSLEFRQHSNGDKR